MSFSDGAPKALYAGPHAATRADETSMRHRRIGRVIQRAVTSCRAKSCASRRHLDEHEEKRARRKCRRRFQNLLQRQRVDDAGQALAVIYDRPAHVDPRVPCAAARPRFRSRQRSGAGQVAFRASARGRNLIIRPASYQSGQQTDSTMPFFVLSCTYGQAPPAARPPCVVVYPDRPCRSPARVHTQRRRAERWRDRRIPTG